MIDQVVPFLVLDGETDFDRERFGLVRVIVLPIAAGQPGYDQEEGKQNLTVSVHGYSLN